MINLISKFKNNLASNFKRRCAYVEVASVELEKIDGVVKEIHALYELPWYRIIKRIKMRACLKAKYSLVAFDRASKFGSESVSINSLIQHSIRGDREKFAKLVGICTSFNEHLEMIKGTMGNLDNYMDAFDEKGINVSIASIEDFFVELSRTNLELDEISRILGMALVFVSRSFDERSAIENMDLITGLAAYYNEDGTFVESSELSDSNFVSLLNDLLGSVLDSGFDFIVGIENRKSISSANFDTVRKIALKCVKNTTPQTSENPFSYNKNADSLQIDFFQLSRVHLNKGEQQIYDDAVLIRQSAKRYEGNIIVIDTILGEIHVALEFLSTDELDGKKIVESDLSAKLAELQTVVYEYNQQLGFIGDSKKLAEFYLKENELAAYNRACEMLTFNIFDTNDRITILSFLRDINAALELLGGSSVADKGEDKSLVRSEISEWIRKLEQIVSKTKYDEEVVEVVNGTDNRYIFLLDANAKPFIYSDIVKYKLDYDTIISGIEKITPDRKSTFKPVEGKEARRRLYYSSIADCYISFVEIDEGIYVIVGASRRDHGYKELLSRLRTYSLIVDDFEAIVKNSATREDILVEHKQYSETRNDSSVLARKRLS